MCGGVAVARNLLVFASYLVDHELATAIAKASDDDLAGRRACSKAAGGFIDSQFSHILSVTQKSLRAGNRVFFVV
jgi:hypothetical protein